MENMIQLCNIVTRGRNIEEKFHVPQFWRHKKIAEHSNVKQKCRGRGFLWLVH